MIAGSLLAGCNTHEENHTHEHETISEKHAHPHEDPHDEYSEEIELNGGEKWAVNDEMKPFIQEAEEALNSFEANEPTDYHQLASLLKEKNTALINSCTMEGKSHDELHKWLHPHLELVEELTNSEEAAHSGEIVQKLEASFEKYHQYFQ